MIQAQPIQGQAQGTLPPNGAVLVIYSFDLTDMSFAANYPSRVYFRVPSEIRHETDIPVNVQVLLIHARLPEHEKRQLQPIIKRVRDKRRGLPRVIQESDLTTLQYSLLTLLGPSTPKQTAAAVVQVSAPKPLGLPSPRPSAPPASLRPPAPPPSPPPVRAVVTAPKADVDEKLLALKARAHELVDVGALTDIPMYVDPEMPARGTGEVQSEAGFFWAPIDQIEPMPQQPRGDFPKADMLILASGVKKHGQEEPVWVKRISGNPRRQYQLVEGERRLLVGHALGLSHLKLTFRKPKSPIDQFRMSVGANYGKLKLTPMEAARAAERLRLEDPELQGKFLSRQYELLAPMFQKSAAWVEYTHRFLRLHPELQVRVEPTAPKADRISQGLAQYLSTIPDQDFQLHVANVARDRQLTVDQARNYARKRAGESGQPIGSGRARRPSDDFVSLMRFVAKFSASLGIYLDRPQANFKAMFQRRDEEQVTALVKELEAGDLQLQELIEAVKNR